MSFEPDYNLYSASELVDVYEHIDRESFPERFQKICEIMEEKGLLQQTNSSSLQLTDKAIDAWAPSEVESETSYTSQPPEPAYDSEGNYIPNEVPGKDRIANACLSLIIIIYGGYGLYINQLWLPLARRVSIILTDFAAVLMFVAIVSASVVMIIEVVDHYDKRDNEHAYYRLAVYFKYFGYITFAVAVLVGLAMGAELN